MRLKDGKTNAVSSRPSHNRNWSTWFHVFSKIDADSFTSRHIKIYYNPGRCGSDRNSLASNAPCGLQLYMLVSPLVTHLALSGSNWVNPSENPLGIILCFRSTAFLCPQCKGMYQHVQICLNWQLRNAVMLFISISLFFCSGGCINSCLADEVNT